MCTDADRHPRLLTWQQIDEQTVLACPDRESCKWVFWDNPTPVVACLIPIPLQPLPRRALWMPALFDNDPTRYGIVAVKRGVNPFKDQWCLPCGHINRKENPKAAGRRETLEECSLQVRLISQINSCTPQVEGLDLNDLVLIYMAHAIGGELRHGSDARDARIFSVDELPKLCFSSHQLAADDFFAGRLGSLTYPKQIVDRKEISINLNLSARTFVGRT
jgi:8-oxo-dGTP diphosphatase